MVDETFSSYTKPASTYNYYPLSDIHLGSPMCNEDELARWVKQIRDDPMARWSLGGDVGDLITPKDRRWQHGVLAERYLLKAGRIPDATLEHAEGVFAPIAAKCWFLGVGNHEQTIAKHYDRGIGAELAARLGIPERYIGYRGFCGVAFRHLKTGAATTARLWIDFHHGWQAGRSYGPFHGEAERLLGHSPAEIILRGHSHKRQAHVFTSWVFGHQRPRQQTRIVACCGTFLQSHEWHRPVDAGHMSDVADDGWAETKGFRPSDPLGPPVLHIRIPQRSRGSAGQPSLHLSVTLP